MFLRVHVLMTSTSVARSQRGAQLRQALASPHPVASQATSRGLRTPVAFDPAEGHMVRKLGLMTVVLALVAGCALSSHPRIADLKYNPGRYQNHSVTVDGVVTSSWGIPLLPLRLYKVDDGTGELTVLSQNGRVPTRGAHVRVRGRVEQFATFGGQSVGLHLEQQDLKFKRGW
jgi:hypothetical protein